jgi:hypothetical protein
MALIAHVRVCRGADGSTDFRYQLNAVIHEMFHALGFSSSLFSMWRNSDGEIYDSGTPRTHSRTHAHQAH